MWEGQAAMGGARALFMSGELCSCSVIVPWRRRAVLSKWCSREQPSDGQSGASGWIPDLAATEESNRWGNWGLKPENKAVFPPGSENVNRYTYCICMVAGGWHSSKPVMQGPRECNILRRSDFIVAQKLYSSIRCCPSFWWSSPDCTIIFAMNQPMFYCDASAVLCWKREWYDHKAKKKIRIPFQQLEIQFHSGGYRYWNNVSINDTADQFLKNP